MLRSISGLIRRYAAGKSEPWAGERTKTVDRTCYATANHCYGVPAAGGIDSPDRLWEALLRGDDPGGLRSADRWDIDEVLTRTRRARTHRLQMGRVPR